MRGRDKARCRILPKKNSEGELDAVLAAVWFCLKELKKQVKFYFQSVFC